ncbi:hypothetical protein V1514DRAFT_235566 [Lipomyces japonicus]|uniref:uncharacterized protein n=1 Tax=Lipomyces japonicus TaxID=56871 RepID=UPI0034CE03AB
MSEPNEKLDRLVKWLESRGVIISNAITARAIPGRGIGVVAVSKVASQEPIIQFPVDALLNPRTVRQKLTELIKSDISVALKLFQPHLPITTVKKTLAKNLTKRVKTDKTELRISSVHRNALNSLSSHQLLAYYLYQEAKLHDQGEQAEWALFIDVLPRLQDFKSVPLVWHVLQEENSKNLLPLLPNTTLQHAQRMIKQFNNDFQTVRSIFANVDDLNQFLWAWMCVNSRCLYFHMEEAPSSDDCMTLAPLVDFLNHTDINHCTIDVIDTSPVKKFSKAQKFILETGRSYEPGEEIFLSYGPHTNSFLLCEYGFILDQNQNTQLDITNEIINLVCQGNENHPKAKYLAKYGYWGDYTVQHDSISYRTEVALAVAQVSDAMVQDEPAKTMRQLEAAQLKAYMIGVTDGYQYKARSNELLAPILHAIIKNGQDAINQLSRLDLDFNVENIINLYKELIWIAESQLV